MYTVYEYIQKKCNYDLHLLELYIGFKFSSLLWTESVKWRVFNDLVKEPPKLQEMLKMMSQLIKSEGSVDQLVDQIKQNRNDCLDIDEQLDSENKY